MRNVSYLMHAFVLVLVLLTACVSASALADCADVASEVRQFVRSHQAHHFNGEPPSLVDDELTIWQAKSGVDCFRLTTVGPNYHECEVTGFATPVPGEGSEFRDANCTIMFEKTAETVKVTVSPGWERLGRGGTCTRKRCGMFGEVESGTFRHRR
jgi:hypothetical protein